MSGIVRHIKIVTVFLFAVAVAFAFDVASQERVLFDPERALASYKGSVIHRLCRDSDTGNAVLELGRATRLWPDGSEEIRPTVQALLYDVGTGKFRELGMWDAIRSVDFAAGTCTALGSRGRGRRKGLSSIPWQEA